jgi:hypothetical protein
MRQPFSGEIARLALVAVASVSTVGLFTFLALHQPDRLLSPSGSPTKSPPGSQPPMTSFELRREPAQVEAPARKGEIGEARDAPLAAPEPQGGFDPAVGADEGPTPSAPIIERAVMRDAGASAPASRRKSGRSEVWSGSSAKRHSLSKPTRNRESFGSLPNRKCGEHEETERLEPQDPLSDFIGGF